MALWSLHEERPDLVQKYTAFLEEQFEAHLALSQYFTPSGEVELTPGAAEDATHARVHPVTATVSAGGVCLVVNWFEELRQRMAN